MNSHCWKCLKTFECTFLLFTSQHDIFSLFLSATVGQSKPTHGLTPKDSSSQPKSLHVILFIYLFLWVIAWILWVVNQPLYLCVVMIVLCVADRGSQHLLLFFLSFFLLCLHRVSVLVLSSCYMAFKIVALEHRLNSLLSMGELVDNEWGHRKVSAPWNFQIIFNHK